jgi:hypothetical protein
MAAFTARYPEVGFDLMTGAVIIDGMTPCLFHFLRGTPQNGRNSLLVFVETLAFFGMPTLENVLEAGADDYQ